MIDNQILVALGRDIPCQQLLARRVSEVRGGKALHLAGQALHHAADAPAALPRRLEHGQPDVGAGRVGGVEDGGLVCAVAVPVTERKRRKEIAAGGIF